MPEVLMNEMNMDLTAASGEERRKFGMILESALGMFSFLSFSFLSLILSCFDLLSSLARDDDLVMPKVPADEAASKEEPRDFGVVPESSPGIIYFAFPPFICAIIC